MVSDMVRIFKMNFKVFKNFNCKQFKEFKNT